MLKALSAGRGDMPDLSAFPKSQQVTFKYYEGVLNFLEENYLEVRFYGHVMAEAVSLTGFQAEKHLTMAWNLCHKDAMRNKE